MMNNNLKKHLRAAINDLIKKSARSEAFKILKKSDINKVGEFLYYYHSGCDNVACLVLDTAKDTLVKQKIMKQKNSDEFGGYIDWDVQIANNFKKKHKSKK